MSRLSLFSALLVLLSPAIIHAQTSSGENSSAVETSARVYTDDQLAHVVDVLRHEAPTGSTDILNSTAKQFLDDLAVHRPEQLEKITTDSSLEKFKSSLLQRLASSLAGEKYKSLREELAKRRVGSVLSQNGLGKPEDATASIEKIKASSSYYLQRLVDGKVDDDELLSMLKRARGGNDVASDKKIAQPKVLSAGEIVSEFARRNQVGAAADRLFGYKMEASLTTSTGAVQELFLYRMRPDRFRLVVRVDGVTQLILGASGTDYWQQVPGKSAQRLTAKAMGGRVYLSEFLNPLFDADNTNVTREADGTIEGRKVFRIGVKRADESRYISCVDQETFKEVARENEDGTKVTTSDFRDVAGITFAFREEAIGAKGEKGVFVVKKIVPNLGIVQSLFDAPSAEQPNYFNIEQMIGTVAANGAKP